VSALPAVEHADSLLTVEVLAHLDAQLVSVRRLLQVVLAQGAAIQKRDVANVVSLTGILQAELQRRKLLEDERARLLERAGIRLGLPAGGVTLALMEQLMDAESAAAARSRSAELQGMLEQVQREHYVNRALMSQELAFLDHLLRLAGQGDTVYDASGERPAARRPAMATHRVFDLEV
jgi:flagellar biosynthesis/type III secretory pathway chaperone